MTDTLLANLSGLFVLFTLAKKAKNNLVSTFEVSCNEVGTRPVCIVQWGLEYYNCRISTRKDTAEEIRTKIK